MHNYKFSLCIMQQCCPRFGIWTYTIIELTQIAIFALFNANKMIKGYNVDQGFRIYGAEMNGLIFVCL